MPIKPTLEMLYTNIGRGHPFYLDGIVDALIHRGEIGLIRHQQDVFELSRSLSLLGWKTARWLYERGSSGGTIGWVYNKVRNGDYNRPGPALRIMGRDIRRRFGGTTTPLLVAHPTLVGILRDRPSLIYQHGEPSVPPESLVRGATTVLVPTRSAADQFIAAGYPREAVFVSGLCIEPALARQAEDALLLRKQRLADRGSPLTGAFFSSGAEPSGHVEQLVQAAISSTRAGHAAILFAVQGGKLASRATELFQGERIRLPQVPSEGGAGGATAGGSLVTYRTRRELTALTARFFPSIDFFVSPAHERVNWALGLGLPLFVVEPCIGPFAGRNHALVLSEGVARRLTEEGPAADFGPRLSALRDQGELSRMCDSGWAGKSIDGFARIAALLVEQYGR